jgi:hypothetical protein
MFVVAATALELEAPLFLIKQTSIACSVVVRCAAASLRVWWRSEACNCRGVPTLAVLSITARRPPCVTSQLACTRTVEAEKAVHSLHSYFLLPGDDTIPIIFVVRRRPSARCTSVACGRRPTCPRYHCVPALVAR